MVVSMLPGLFTVKDWTITIIAKVFLAFSLAQTNANVYLPESERLG